MNRQSTLIYELKGLIKTCNDQTVLNIGRLQFHRGTVYGIIGPIGCGKSTLMKIMAAIDKESAGTIKYEGESFESNWLGKIRPYPEIQLFRLNRNLKGGKVSALFNKKPTNEFVLQYFNKGTCKTMLEKNVKDLRFLKKLRFLKNSHVWDPRWILWNPRWSAPPRENPAR